MPWLSLTLVPRGDDAAGRCLKTMMRAGKCCRCVSIPVGPQGEETGFSGSAVALPEINDIIAQGDRNFRTVQSDLALFPDASREAVTP